MELCCAGAVDLRGGFVQRRRHLYLAGTGSIFQWRGFKNGILYQWLNDSIVHGVCGISFTSTRCLQCSSCIDFVESFYFVHVSHWHNLQNTGVANNGSNNIDSQLSFSNATLFSRAYASRL